MYNVHMKRYTVSHVRERLSDALDEAERGQTVIIERKGVRYRLSVETKRQTAAKSQPAIEVLDAAVAEGDWTWNWTAAGLKYRRRS